MPIKDIETRRAYYRAWYRKRHPDAKNGNVAPSIAQTVKTDRPIVKKEMMKPKSKRVWFWTRLSQGGLVPD